MIWLVIAAQLNSAVPSTPLLTHNDVPIRMLRENVEQTVRVAVTVKPDGKVQSCAIERRSGNSKLDAYTCKLLSRRAKFSRPTLIDGSPSYGVYRTSINWWVGDGRPPSRPLAADLYVTVSSLPGGVKAPFAVRLKLAVDEKGRLSNCSPEKSKDHSALVPIACEQLIRTFALPPARSSEGLAVSSVQNATVVFEAR